MQNACSRFVAITVGAITFSGRKKQGKRYSENVVTFCYLCIPHERDIESAMKTSCPISHPFPILKMAAFLRMTILKRFS